MSLGLGAYGTVQTHPAPLRIRFHIPASSRTQAKCTDQKGRDIFKLATLEMIVWSSETLGVAILLRHSRKDFNKGSRWSGLEVHQS